MNRRYFEPSSLEQALTIIAQVPGAAIVAGGTDLVVGDRSGKRPLPETLVAIHRIKELRGITAVPGGGLRLGALVTHADLEREAAVRDRFTALADAASLVGSPATRFAGTIGGNLTNASPAMESGSPLLIFEATVELAAATGRRTLPVQDFLLGPAKTALKPGEILTAVVLPSPPGHRSASAYLRLEYRQAMEIAIVGAAALMTLDDSGRCQEARLALTAVAPTCIRAGDAEAVLRGQPISDELVERAAQAAAAAARPIDDVRGSADYRRAMVAVIAGRALSMAWKRVASPVGVGA